MNNYVADGVFNTTYSVSNFYVRQCLSLLEFRLKLQREIKVMERENTTFRIFGILLRYKW